MRAATPVRLTAAQRALQSMRQAIIDGKIAPAQPLREAQLAAQLGIGRSSVREAVRHLIQEGLVEHHLNRGVFVKSFSGSDIFDLYFAREAIEVAAAEHVVSATDPPNLSRLHSAFVEIKLASANDNKPSERLIHADASFHRELVRLANSPLLSHFYETLSAETVMLLRHHPSYPAASYIESHRVLLVAAERRDPAMPRQVTDHLRQSAELLRSELAERSSRA
jgi:DNA-binding GntR family transcriptional regulator